MAMKRSEEKLRLIKRAGSLLCTAGLLICLVGCGKEGGVKEVTTMENTEETSNVQETSDTQETSDIQDSDSTLPEPEALKDVYQDYFYLGIALNPETMKGQYKDTVLKNFNSVTCENEMKPDYILDHAASKEKVNEDNTYISLNFKNCQKAITYCEENDLKMRYHTLVWHAQTPNWFFYEGYDTNQSLADAETVKLRMKNFIFQVIDYFDTNHPDLIYAIDVVNEAFNGKGDYGIKETENLWYDTLGADYVYYAFLYTKQAIDASAHMQEVTLVYNDYNMSQKVSVVSNGLEQIFANHNENVLDYIDAVGFQAHLDNSTAMRTVANAMREFSTRGYEIQITELDIGIPDIKVGEEPTEEQLVTQGKKYRSLMERVMALVDEGCNISSVSVWGLSDQHSWRKNTDGKDAFALLWDKSMEEKPALRGMALCDDIMSYYQNGLNN